MKMQEKRRAAFWSLRILGYAGGLGGVLAIGFSRVWGRDAPAWLPRAGYGLVVLGFVAFAACYALVAVDQLLLRSKRSSGR